jgi:hypothetical protein
MGLERVAMIRHTERFQSVAELIRGLKPIGLLLFEEGKLTIIFRFLDSPCHVTLQRKSLSIPGIFLQV